MSDNLCLSGIEIVVVICSYGRNELTFQAVRDVGDPAIACRVLVVDNQGTVNLPSSENVGVIRPGSNLGGLAVQTWEFAPPCPTRRLAQLCS